jgi:lactose/cellobiose-specific phosphotransferase system IIC component
MIEKLDTWVSKLANQQTIRSLRRGLLYLMPFVLMGSAVLALLNLPIPANQEFTQRIFGEGWRELGLRLHKCTLQIMAITTLITVSYAVSEETSLVKSGEINQIVIVITALSSYIAFNSSLDIVVSASDAGSTSMFKAIVISVLSCRMFCLYYKVCERVRSTDLINYNGSALIRSAFKAFFPALFTMSSFILIKMLFDSTSVIRSTALLSLTNKWLNGHNYFFALAIILITHVSWFFGIHGGNVIMDAISGATPVVSATAEASILTKEFFDVYVYLGGAGATMGLLVALLLTGKDSSESRLAKVSVLPCIFNINEIIIFGLPIIFNPYYFIPFILTPILLSFTSWAAILLGFVPPVTQAVIWTTPIFLSGYLSSGSISGIILQAINLAFAVLIYIPFIRLQQRHRQRNKVTVFKNLGNEIQYIQTKEVRIILNRHDEIGALARALVSEIKESFKQQTSTLHLEYQPKVDSRGKIIGAEALLRWTHPVYGYVSPLIILCICDEAGLTNTLGQWVMDQAFSDLKRWHEQGYKTSVSVNLSPQQLQEDEVLVQNIAACIKKTGVDPKYMEFELTENSAIDLSMSTQSKLKQIRNMGINLSIDDFGMGHSSLLYLCDFYANIVKIDISLIRTIVNDSQRQQIVKGIFALCSQLNVKAVAEGVETIEQIQILQALGCKYYQGFYFSKSLDYYSFISYVNHRGTAEDDYIN